MCLTLLQELKGRLYFEDSSDFNCVNSIILLYFVYLIYFFMYEYKSRDMATYILNKSENATLQLSIFHEKVLDKKYLLFKA